MTEPAPTLSEEELAKRPFDELVVELQRIVQQLEAGSVGLEASIGLYRQGLALHAACEARLRDAELKITELGRGAQSQVTKAPDSA